MNWIKKTLRFGEKIKKIIKKRASKEEIADVMIFNSLSFKENT